ncbi:MAG: hypothetical protein QW379_08615 [Thermoplasmata archaeon]
MGRRGAWSAGMRVRGQRGGGGTEAERPTKRGAAAGTDHGKAVMAMGEARGRTGEDGEPGRAQAPSGRRAKDVLRMAAALSGRGTRVVPRKGATLSDRQAESVQGG